MVTAARELAGSLSADSFLVQAIGGHQGSNHERLLVLRSEDEIADSPELLSDGLARAAGRRRPSVILLGSTRTGRMIAGRLSVMLGWGCLSDIHQLKTDGKSLSGVRSLFAGKVLAEVRASLPCIATVKVGAYPRPTETREGVEVEEVGRLRAKVEVRDTIRKQASVDDIRTASVIVSAGRGFRSKRDLQLATDLAEALGGSLGCSRPISSDYGWLPEERHIGLTGVTVRPALYLALGISGQLQHVAGIKESRVIAAVNSDREAPIFQVCDYGIVGDLYEVVPAMLKILKS